MKKLVIILLSLLLSACATLPSSKPPSNKPMTWEDRSVQLNLVKDWELKGAISVETVDDAWSASLNWVQRGDDYQMRLYGPLVSAYFKLRGEKDRVTLITSKNEQFVAKDAESLVLEQMGWRLPVSNLYYWVRGLPVPGRPAVKHFDQFKHIDQLSQDGWQLEYLRYTAVNGIDLPSRINLSHPDLKVRIVIRNWEHAV